MIHTNNRPSKYDFGEYHFASPTEIFLNDFSRDTANHGCIKRINIIRSCITSDSPYAMGRFKCLSRD